MSADTKAEQAANPKMCSHHLPIHNSADFHVPRSTNMFHKLNNNFFFSSFIAITTTTTSELPAIFQNFNCLCVYVCVSVCVCICVGKMKQISLHNSLRILLGKRARYGGRGKKAVCYFVWS